MATDAQTKHAILFTFSEYLIVVRTLPVNENSFILLSSDHLCFFFVAAKCAQLGVRIVLEEKCPLIAFNCCSIYLSEVCFVSPTMWNMRLGKVLRIKTRISQNASHHNTKQNREFSRRRKYACGWLNYR